MSEHFTLIPEQPGGNLKPQEALDIASSLIRATNFTPRKEPEMTEQPECPTCGNDHLDEDGFDRVGCAWGPAPEECGTCAKCYCDGSC